MENAKNLTQNKGVPHKNEKEILRISIRSYFVILYYTRCYKIIKIETKNESNIIFIDFSVFYELLVSSYLENSIIKNSLKLQKYRFELKSNNTVFYIKNQILFSMNKSSIKLICVKMNRFYLSYLLSFHTINHMRKNDILELINEKNHSMKDLNSSLNEMKNKFKRYFISDKTSIAKLFICSHFSIMK